MLKNKTVPMIEPGVMTNKEIKQLLADADQLDRERYYTGNFDAFSAWEWRRQYTDKYGFHIYSKEQIEMLAEILQGQKVIEVLSGTGHFAKCLEDKGVNIKALDNSSWVESGKFKELYKLDFDQDALQFNYQGYDTVIMCWPPHDNPITDQILAKMKRGQVLLYQGEHRGGCCADDAFFEMLEKRAMELEMPPNWPRFKFDGLHDDWYKYVIVK
jgi:ubiquinone/menaquinone biosynthesis C-methylase UbiE